MDHIFLSLIETLKSSDLMLRTEAIDKIVELGTNGTLDLCRYLTDNDPRIRKGVARALGRIRDVRSVQALINALAINSEHDLEDEEESEVQVDVILALGNIGHESAYSPLMDMLPFTLQNNVTVSWYVMDALEMLGNPRAIPKLEELYSYPDPDVQKTSKRVVNKLQKLME